MVAPGSPSPRLMIVGPGELHASDLEVFGQQLVAHYGDDWTRSHADAVDAVRRFVDASEDPYLLPGSGSNALEAAMVNLFESGDRVVIPNTGYFGDRLIAIARALGLDALEVPVHIGVPVDPDEVSQAVKKHAAVGVLVCHVDTSVATRSDIEAIAAAAAAHGAITMVDGIASVGGDTCSVDRMQLACLVTSTQKGMEAPPGLGIVALGPTGRARIDARSKPPATWINDFSNWDRFREEWPHHPHPVTMPASIMLAMTSSLERIQRLGLDKAIAEKHRLAARVRQGLSDLGLEPVAQQDAQAGMIVAAHTDRSAEIVSTLLKEGIQIAGGLAPLAGKAIRVGLMGATATDDMVDKTLDAIGRVVRT